MKHPAALELSTASTSILMGMRQLSHAASRGEWSEATTEVATALEAALEAAFLAIESLANRAAKTDFKEAL